MLELNRAVDLTDAYAEAWTWGPAWREAITSSVNALGADTQEALRAGLKVGAGQLGIAPDDIGLSGSR